MVGALIETEARNILKQGIEQGIGQGVSAANRATALRMLKRGKLTISKIAEDTGLSVAETESLAEIQTVEAKKLGSLEPQNQNRRAGHLQFVDTLLY